jgi:hypothetical protein
VFLLKRASDCLYRAPFGFLVGIGVVAVATHGSFMYSDESPAGHHGSRRGAEGRGTTFGSRSSSFVPAPHTWVCPFQKGWTSPSARSPKPDEGFLLHLDPQPVPRTHYGCRAHAYSCFLAQTIEVAKCKVSRETKKSDSFPPSSCFVIAICGKIVSGSTRLFNAMPIHRMCHSLEIFQRKIKWFNLLIDLCEVPNSGQNRFVVL